MKKTSLYKHLTYDVITSWWDVVAPLIEDEKLLKDGINEVVALNGNTALAKFIINKCGGNAKAKHSLVVLQFDASTGELLKTFLIEVNSVLNEDDFSNDLNNDNGVLRLVK